MMNARVSSMISRPWLGFTRFKDYPEGNLTCLKSHAKFGGYHWNRLVEQIIMAGQIPLLTEFGIY